MDTDVKFAVAILAAVVLFAGGYRYAAAVYKADIAELREEHARAAKELTDEYRIYENETNERLAQAWESFEQARAESIDLRSDVVRVRDEAARLERRLSTAGDDSCKLERRQLARGASLVQRFAESAERCVRLAQECALEKNAIIRITEK